MMMMMMMIASMINKYNYTAVQQNTMNQLGTQTKAEPNRIHGVAQTLRGYI